MKGTASAGERGDLRPAVNVFRGVAALFVVLYHLWRYTSVDWFGHFPVLRFGYLGVDFFFVLSGLVISHVYLDEARKGLPGFWLKFLWLRISRLFPLHAVVMCAMLLAAVTVPLVTQTGALPGAQSLLDWLSLTLLIRQWFLPEGFVWNSPAWSVSAEFFAYAVLFPVIVWLNRHGPRYLAMTVQIGVGSAILLLLWTSFGTIHVIPGAGPILRVTAGFLIGSALFLGVQTVRQALIFDRSLALALILFPACMIAFAPFLPRVVAEFGFLAAVTLIITFAYLADGPVAKALSHPLPFYFGEISFALYLCHIPMMRLTHWLTGLAGIERGLAVGMAMVLLSLLTAHLLHRYVEVPTRTAMRLWYARRAQLRSPSVAEA